MATRGCPSAACVQAVQSNLHVSLDLVSSTAGAAAAATARQPPHTSAPSNAVCASVSLLAAALISLNALAPLECLAKEQKQPPTQHEQQDGAHIGLLRGLRSLVSQPLPAGSSLSGQAPAIPGTLPTAPHASADKVAEMRELVQHQKQDATSAAAAAAAKQHPHDAADAAAAARRLAAVLRIDESAAAQLLQNEPRLGDLSERQLRVRGHITHRSVRVL